MYYVVTKSQALAMQGSKHFNSGRGTCKGIYKDATKAASYILDNRLQASYTIVYFDGV